MRFRRRSRQQVLDLVDQCPVREAHALSEEIGGDVIQSIQTCGHDQRPEVQLLSTQQAVSNDDEDIQRGNGVDGCSEAVDPGQKRTAFVPEEDGDDIDELRGQVGGNEPCSCAAPATVMRHAEEKEEDHPHRDVLRGFQQLGHELRFAEGKGEAIGRQTLHADEPATKEIEGEPEIQTLFAIAEIEQKAEDSGNENDGRDKNVREPAFIASIKDHVCQVGENFCIA
jgi:hypothetical protein